MKHPFPDSVRLIGKMTARFTSLSFRLSITLLSLASVAPLASATPIPIGAVAPKITTADQDGNPINLGAVFAEGYTLIYFYPKAGTPGCTAEACHLRDSFAELKDKGIRVIGVSLDKPESQKNFQTKNHLPFTLIPDADHAVSKSFGVPSFLGMDKRQSFLIHQGVVIWSDLNADPATQADEVLQVVDHS